MPIAQQLDPGARLPLIDMAAGSLRAMSEPQYRQFERNLRALVEADDRIDLFEWCLQHILLHHLMPEFGRARRPRVRYYALAGVRGDCEVLLSTLAHVGQREPDAVRRAFDAGAARLGIRGLALRPADQFGLDALDRALETLNTVSMPRKRKLLDACAACIIADRRITAREAELLRAVSDYLDCPMPPLLPAQPPA